MILNYLKSTCPKLLLFYVCVYTILALKSFVKRIFVLIFS
ncbi:putative membrane protein [Helicobacter pylori NQ4200]|uniref:Putative membrane protein n=1 Tax=Helicobacter pylori NQ4200 TaxID=992024 RepID=I9YUD3_HELPX|nr:putative membrane protein [Helicobacter pylori NQ4200]